MLVPCPSTSISKTPRIPKGIPKRFLNPFTDHLTYTTSDPLVRFITNACRTPQRKILVNDNFSEQQDLQSSHTFLKLLYFDLREITSKWRPANTYLKRIAVAEITESEV